MKTLMALVLVMATAVVALGAENPLAWPRFRGPGGSGVAQDQRPPIELGPNRNVKWRVAVPSGLSSPIVAGDKLVITAIEDDKLYTIAYSRATGKEAWRVPAPAERIEAYNKAEGSPAASTPVTDGERIVSYFGSCGLLCYDLEGNELWRYKLPVASSAGDFGSGTSPILADGTVVLVRDQTQGSKIIALDAADGSPKWDQPRQSPASWCTPVVWDTPAGKQVAAAGHGRMVGYDLTTGAERWWLVGMPSGCCSSPVVADGVLFFAGWSPGGGDDPEFQMPTFDQLLKNLDKDADGALSRAEADAAFEGMFDSQDTDKDGQITRQEFDAIVKFMAEGVSSAFALKAGGSGDVTQSHVLWKQTRGLPYIASAILYRGQYVMVKDGGLVTSYDAQTGAERFGGRLAAVGKYYASPVAAGGHIYFTSLDGAVTVVNVTGQRPVVAARNPALEERTAATPAIADDTLYIRTAGNLYAFTEEAQ